MLYRIFVLSFAFFSLSAFAETVNAPWQITPVNASTGTLQSPQLFASQSAAGDAGCAYAASTIGQSGTFSNWNASYNQASCNFSVWGANSNGGHLTQVCPSGSVNIGSAPSLQCQFSAPCTAPQVRDPLQGLCVPPAGTACTVPENDKVGTTYSFQWPTPSGVKGCAHSCQVYAGNCAPASGGYALCEAFSHGTPCTRSDSPPTEVDDKKSPPCGPSEGVMTSTSGKVACVPPGTPGAEAPKKNSSSSTTTNDDGSSSTKTTITICTGAGACSSSTTTTTTGAGGGSTPGKAGTPGTSTTQGEKAASDTPGFCAANPSLQICKGGLNEEVTQKKIADSLSASGFDPASHLTVSDASEAEKQAVLDKYNIVLQEAQKFGGASDIASAKYAEFKDIMGSWWEPITVAGCSPFSHKIGPWTWDFDICPTAAKISEIGAYCMWVLLAFGMFAATTKEAK